MCGVLRLDADALDFGTRERDRVCERLRLGDGLRVRVLEVVREDDLVIRLGECDDRSVFKVRPLRVRRPMSCSSTAGN